MPRPKSPVRLEWVDPAVCSLEYRLKLIGRLPFFRHLPADAISRINKLFHDFDASAGEWIYFEGDPATYYYLVAMGKVKLVRNTGSGRDVAVGNIARRGFLRLALNLWRARPYGDRHRPDGLLYPENLRGRVRPHPGGSS